MIKNGTKKLRLPTRCKRNNGGFSYWKILVFLLSLCRNSKIRADLPVTDVYTNTLGVIRLVKIPKIIAQQDYILFLKAEM